MNGDVATPSSPPSVLPLALSPTRLEPEIETGEIEGAVEALLDRRVFEDPEEGVAEDLLVGEVVEEVVGPHTERSLVEKLHRCGSVHNPLRTVRLVPSKSDTNLLPEADRAQQE